MYLRLKGCDQMNFEAKLRLLHKVQNLLVFFAGCSEISSDELRKVVLLSALGKGPHHSIEEMVTKVTRVTEAIFFLEAADIGEQIPVDASAIQEDIGRLYESHSHDLSGKADDQITEWHLRKEVSKYHQENNLIKRLSTADIFGIG